MYALEKEVRAMIVNIVKEYNRAFLNEIAKNFKLNEQYLIDKYLVEYYYMPVIEKTIKSIDI